jgi:hypothetical protein
MPASGIKDEIIMLGDTHFDTLVASSQKIVERTKMSLSKALKTSQKCLKEPYCTFMTVICEDSGSKHERSPTNTITSNGPRL